MGHISEAEMELLKIIWENGNTALYTEIADVLNKKGKDWSKNTIITLLSRLIDKGALKAEKHGRKNQYIAIISDMDYQTEQTRTFLDKVYEGRASSLVSTLIQNNFISENEYDELSRFWKDAKDGK
nr:BlaI/MecI/CopY family transcriptional regulator [uncultured Eisenbergiella sp.]